MNLKNTFTIQLSPQKHQNHQASRPWKLSTEAISNNLACSCDQVTDEQQEQGLAQKKRDLISKNMGFLSDSTLLGGWPTLWNIWKSMGRIIPYIMDNKSHVWNHPPEHDLTDFTHQISCSNDRALVDLVDRGSVNSSTTASLLV